VSDSDVSLETARTDAEAARTELRLALDDALGRLSPSRLKAEAAQVASHQIDEVKIALRRSVTSHPLIAWPALALIATAFVYLLRQPVLALVRECTGAVTMLRRRFFRKETP
jgi:hypothetical protein